MADRTRILLVSGSTRGGSANTAALRTLREVAPRTARRPVTAVLYEGLSELPAFNPDDDRDPLPAAAGRLRQAIGPDGLVSDPGFREEVARVIDDIVDAVG